MKITTYILLIYELQSEAEGEVPVSPSDPAHRAAPALAQEYLLPDQGAAHHERGSAAEGIESS